MMETVREAMTKDPITVNASTPIRTAAEKMKEAGVGAVVIAEDDGKLQGIVTDRDIAIRAVAAGMDTKKTPVSKICSQDLATLSPDDNARDAVDLMRKKAIRRIPVVEDGKAIGILSLGDLAVDRDPESALAEISAAQPNV